jgi:hypothetical protein
MAEPSDAPAAIVAAAAAKARELVPTIGALLLTHYPDAETLETLLPGGPDLATMRAVNRAVAAECLTAGTKVMVQLADRAAFRRWLDLPSAEPRKPHAWRSRAPRLQGDAALACLGLTPPRPPKPGRAAGTPAERLVRAFADQDDPGFEALAEELLESGRQGVLEQALRRTAERYGEEAAEDMAVALALQAEAASFGPSGWAALVALPVALPADGPPDPRVLAESLLGAGVLPEDLELRLLPEWRSAEAAAAMTPCALRQALHEMLDGKPPGALPPAPAEALEGEDFAVLIGLQFDWAIPRWEEIDAEGLPKAPAEAEDAEDEAEEVTETAADLAFDRWRAAAHDRLGGCVPLALVPLSEIGFEIEEFLAEAGAETGGLEEIREFVAMARQEAPGEEVVCRAEITREDGLELSLFTRGGRLLDSISLGPDSLPAPPAETIRLVASFVPMVDDVPRH